MFRAGVYVRCYIILYSSLILISSLSQSSDLSSLLPSPFQSQSFTILFCSISCSSSSLLIFSSSSSIFFCSVLLLFLSSSSLSSPLPSSPLPIFSSSFLPSLPFPSISHSSLLPLQSYPSTSFKVYVSVLTSVYLYPIIPFSPSDLSFHPLPLPFPPFLFYSSSPIFSSPSSSQSIFLLFSSSSLLLSSSLPSSSPIFSSSLSPLIYLLFLSSSFPILPNLQHSDPAQTIGGECRGVWFYLCVF